MSSLERDSTASHVKAVVGLSVAVAGGYTGPTMTREQVSRIKETGVQRVEWLVSHFLCKPSLGFAFAPLLLAAIVMARWDLLIPLAAGLLALWLLRTGLRLHLILTGQFVIPHEK